MLEDPGPGGRGLALRVAEELGLGTPRLQRDMASAEVKKEIEDTRKLATKIGIQGTPHFIVGDRVVAGAPENLPEVLDKHCGRGAQGRLQGLLMGRLAALRPLRNCWAARSFAGARKLLKGGGG